jgi:GNAT superfamily N-acetyltransferase
MQNQILRSIDENKLEACIKAIHDNWTSFVLLFGRTPQFEIKESNQLVTLSSGQKMRLFNRVMKTRLSSSNVDSKIQETIDYFSSSDLPFLWQVYPGDAPDNLSQHLENHGFTRNYGRGMALEIDKLQVPPVPDGFTHKKVNIQELAEIRARLLPKAYGMPDHVQDFLTKVSLSIKIREDYVHYLGFLDGEPVACSTVFYSDGVAGIHSVATLPSARRRGIGAYISAVPLFEARDRGYKVSVLYASEMGFKVYERLGYVEYCKPVHYHWTLSES